MLPLFRSLLAGLAFAVYGIIGIVLWRLLRDLLPADAPLWLSDLVALLPVLMHWLLLPLVSYRWRDVFLLLIPGYGMLLVMKIYWRLVWLHRRDWPLRPEETARPQRLRNADLG